MGEKERKRERGGVKDTERDRDRRVRRGRELRKTQLFCTKSTQTNCTLINTICMQFTLGIVKFVTLSMRYISVCLFLIRNIDKLLYFFYFYVTQQKVKIFGRSM